MKKQLLATLVTLAFASNALAARVVDTIPSEPSMTFDLAVDGGYVFKMINDGEANSALEDSVVDLGTVSGNVMAAADCAAITGLEPMAGLGVSAIASDSDTLQAVAARSATCNLVKGSGTADIELSLPIQALYSISGATSLDIAYSVENDPLTSGFQEAVLTEAVGLIKDEVVGSGQHQLTLALEARLVGSGAKASYTATVKANISED